MGEGIGEMTTMRPQVFECPNCGSRFQAEVLTSTNNFGGQRTDFKQVASGMDPLPAMIHSCQRCGFTGNRSEFRGTVQPEVAEKIKTDIFPHVLDERLDAHTRWEFAARIAEWRGQSVWSVADLYLHAAWCADGDQGKQSYYQRKAADYFEQAIEEEKEQPLQILYLIGELYRRAGDQAVAENWFDKTIAAAGEDSGNKNIKELALRQKTNPTNMI